MAWGVSARSVAAIAIFILSSQTYWMEAWAGPITDPQTLDGAPPSPIVPKLNTFSFTKIAETGSDIPGRPGVFGNASPGAFGAPVVNENVVAFYGVGGTGTVSSQPGIYSYSQFQLDVVVDQGDPIPGEPSGYLFQDLSNPTIDSETIAFGGRKRSSPIPTGIFTADISSGESKAVVRESTQIPGTTDTFGPNGVGFLRPGFAGIAFGGGEIAFLSDDPFKVDGIYKTNADSLQLVADQNTLAPGTSSTFAAFSNVYPNIDIDGGNVAFAAVADSKAGIYAEIDGALSLIANTETSTPNGLENFRTLFYPTIEDGDVTFLGIAPFVEGVYTKSGGSLSPLIETGTLVPGGSSATFTDIQFYSYDAGNIAFTGSAGPLKGIYTDVGGSLEKIIDTNDPLDGKTISGLQISSQSLSGDNIAFLARFEDSTEGIYSVDLFNNDGNQNDDPEVRICIGRPVVDNCFVARESTCQSLFGTPCSEVCANKSKGACWTQLIAGSPVSLSQRVDVPDTPGLLSFDYFFETTEGSLGVTLGGVELLSIDAPEMVGSEFLSASAEIASGLLGQTDQILEFVFDGPTGTSLLLDNISFPGLTNGDFDLGNLSGWISTASGMGSIDIIAPLPTVASVAEPGTITLFGFGLLGFGLMGWRKRRET